MAFRSRNSAQNLMSIKRLQKTFAICLTLLSALLIIPGSQAVDVLPEQFSANYKLALGPVELAQMTRKLYRNQQGNFVFESHSKPTGYARWLTSSELKESSEWIYHDGQMRPLHYVYDRSGDKKRHVELKFDWDKQRVTNIINNDPWKMSVPNGALDKILYHLAVVRDLELGKEKFEYQIADGGKLKTVRFEYQGEEVLETKLGRVNTIKMHHPGKRKENDTWLWFAKEFNYLPVQIQQQKKTGKVMITLQSLEGVTRRPETTAETTKNSGVVVD